VRRRRGRQLDSHVAADLHLSHTRHAYDSFKEYRRGEPPTKTR
jgi:hypothetical protein